MNSRYITKIFLIDDDELFSKVIQLALEENDSYDVSFFSTGEQFLECIDQYPDVVIIDYNLPGIGGLEILERVKNYSPDIKTIILSGQEKVDVVVEAYNKGADNYIIKNDNVIFQLKQTLKNLCSTVNLRKEVDELKNQIIDRQKYYKIVGESKPILNILKLIQKIENNNLITLITGESGTGKEVVAKSIHYNSPRKKKPFVAVNLAGIPPDLIESELFGHEKGAFTGATSKRLGKFEEAEGGTLFLDEIGEMPFDLQSKLLRVLQDFKITRLGSNKEKKLDIRVIAATNKNLNKLVSEGKFREDLMYRLQGFLIALPPLKERENDVILLANHFLDVFNKSNSLPKKTFSNSFAKGLLEHDWPGNVRELKSVVERAAILSDSPTIDVDCLILTS